MDIKTCHFSRIDYQFWWWPYFSITAFKWDIFSQCVVLMLCICYFCWFYAWLTFPTTKIIILLFVCIRWFSVMKSITKKNAFFKYTTTRFRTLYEGWRICAAFKNIHYLNIHSLSKHSKHSLSTSFTTHTHTNNFEH